MFPISQLARLFQGASVNRRILRAAASVTAVGILVKIVATFKEFTVAGVYGRSDAMDAFLAAFLIPNLLINLISESMNQALVPTLVRVREQVGNQKGREKCIHGVRAAIDPGDGELLEGSDNLDQNQIGRAHV